VGQERRDRGYDSRPVGTRERQHILVMGHGRGSEGWIGCNCAPFYHPQRLGAIPPPGRTVRAEGLSFLLPGRATELGKKLVSYLLSLRTTIFDVACAI
jgi:hypothetical protein